MDVAASSLSWWHPPALVPVWVGVVDVGFGTEFDAEVDAGADAGTGVAEVDDEDAESSEDIEGVEVGVEVEVGVAEAEEDVEADAEALASDMAGIKAADIDVAHVDMDYAAVSQAGSQTLETNLSTKTGADDAGFAASVIGPGECEEASYAEASAGAPAGSSLAPSLAYSCFDNVAWLYMDP